MQQLTIVWIGLIVLAATSALLVFGGCRSERPARRPLALVASGDTSGWITPCGCASNQSGGLPRRATYVDRLRENADVILLDAGGAPGGVSEYQRVKFEAILRGEAVMGLDAHNLGEKEVALGSAYLRETARANGTPFVSANVTDRDGNRIAEPMRIIERADRRIVVIGVLSQQFAGDSVRISDPTQAVLTTLGAIHEPFDALVVLAYLPENDLIRMAESLPEAEIVIGGPTGQSLTPRRIGATWVASATNKGKFLLECFLKEGRVSDPPCVIEMSGGYADHPEQLDVLRAYKLELEHRDVSAIRSGLASTIVGGGSDAYRIAGTNSCVDCHAVDADVWNRSKHAHAWQTLQSQGFHVDSYCQQCHTTGFGIDGGFISARRSSDRVSVGCESCHGPSQSHAKDPDVPTPWIAKDQCRRCHDSENSPSFDYDVYWPRIEHGGRVKTAPTRLDPISSGVRPRSEP